MQTDTDGLDNPNDDDGLDDPSGPDSPNTPIVDPVDTETTELERLRAALKRTRTEAQTHREAHEAAVTELDALRQSQLVEQGEYKTLYETEMAKSASLSIEAEKAERLEQAVIATNEKRILQLPDHMRDIVPDMSPEETSAWLDKALPKLTAAPIPDFDGGAGGIPGKKPPTKVTEQDRVAANLAAQSGYPVDAEAIAARREKLNNS